MKTHQELELEGMLCFLDVLDIEIIQSFVAMLHNANRQTRTSNLAKTKGQF